MIKRIGEKNSSFKKIVKKNQIVLLALALMLMTAGYLNYNNNHENENFLLASLGDAQLVSTNVINEKEIQNQVINENISNEIINESENSENIIPENEIIEETSTNEINSDNTTQNNTNQEQINEENTVKEVSNNANDDYFTRSKLERETMYSQMLETYTGILENEKISSEQKDIAENEIKNINDTKNAIMIVENLLQTKDFENVIVFVNSPSVNVVIKGKDLTTEQIAQVQNIVQRELKTEIENIHITTN